MRLPNSLRGAISPSKVTDYLLNMDHPEGGPKARFFAAFGFVGERSEQLMTALYDHPIRHEVAETFGTRFGTKYVIQCEMETPDGRNPCICSVWIVEPDGLPRLVTAYPV